MFNMFHHYRDQGVANRGAVMEVEPEESLPWVEKYRPAELDNIISQNDIITTSKRRKAKMTV